MFGLSLRLALRSGKEALVRLLLTTLAVAVGVAILLIVVAEFHAYQVTNNRPQWELTKGETAAQASPSDPNAELWDYTTDFFQGQTIERLYVAALGPGAPVLPGIPSLPQAGQYYASPAMAALLHSTPADELGDRFPGAQVGIIGDQALSGPDELVIVVGFSPQDLASIPHTLQVNEINTSPAPSSMTNIYRVAFGIIAIALLFPILVLIGSATRLAAARREERYASLRLVGATPGQVNVIASVDSAAGAILGAVFGTGLFALLQPAIAGLKITGERFFVGAVTPTLAGYALALIGVPVATVIASLISLRRVRISPLGVSRKVTPPAPKIWRVLPLLIGIPLFIVPVIISKSLTIPAALGFLLIMVGLMTGGTWLTMQAARLLARLTRGASTLLAARRLADNPQAAFRAISGLILAVFVGTVVAVVLPVGVKGQQTATDTALSNVLRVQLPPGLVSNLSIQDDAALISALEAYPGVTLLPMYANPSNPTEPPSEPTLAPPPEQRTPTDIISSASLAQFPELGQAATGVTAVVLDTSALLDTDNLLYLNTQLPLVTASSTPFSGNPADLALSALLIRVNDPVTLEKVRTFFATYPPTFGYRITPETFGEVGQVRATYYTEAENVSFFVVALVLLVAGAGLAVTVGGSLIERKRPFTLLRLSGTPVSTLNGVILLEWGLPLFAAAVVAALTGIGLGIPLVKSLVPTYAPVPLPGPAYYLIMGAGLLVSLLVVLIILPILSRITRPENAQFE